MQLSLQRHPDERFQGEWTIAQVSLIALPFSPLLGLMGFAGIALSIWLRAGSVLMQRPLTRLILLLSIAFFAVTWFADNVGQALLGLANFLPFLLVFPALVFLLQTPKQLRCLAWCLTISSFPIGLIGLGQLFLGWYGPIRLLGLLINWSLSAGGNPTGRMASVFDYANVLGHYTLVCFLVAMGLWFETSRALQFQFATSHGNADRDQNPFLLVQCLVVSLAIASNGTALILSHSRAAWAIAALGSVLCFLYARWYWLLIALASGLGTILWSAFGPFGKAQLRTIVPAFFWARLTDELHPHRPIPDLRWTQWQFTGSMMSERPLTGWGLRSFGPLYNAATGAQIWHPHNLFLMLGAEVGIPLTLIFVFCVGYILACSIIFLMQDWPWQEENQPRELQAGKHSSDRLIYFTVLLGFLACVAFHTLDITLFDARVNLLGWLLLAGLTGVMQSQLHQQLPISLPIPSLWQVGKR